MVKPLRLPVTRENDILNHGRKGGNPYYNRYFTHKKDIPVLTKKEEEKGI